MSTCEILRLLKKQGGNVNVNIEEGKDREEGKQRGYLAKKKTKSCPRPKTPALEATRSSSWEVSRHLAGKGRRPNEKEDSAEGRREACASSADGDGGTRGLEQKLAFPGSRKKYSRP